MNTNSQNSNKLYALLIFSALILLISGFIFNTSFVAKYLTSDGIINSKAIIIKIDIIQSLLLAFGTILLFDSVVAFLRGNNLEPFLYKTVKKINNILISSKFYGTNDSSLLKGAVLVWIMFLLLGFTSQMIDFSFNWKKAKGYEYSWIAKSIEQGHGFSFSYKKGLTEKDYNGKYFLTAHEEPIYPYFLAFTTKIFKEQGRLVTVLLQVMILFMTSVAVYFLASKIFNKETALLAAFIILLLPSGSYLIMRFNPAVVTGFTITIAAYLTIWCSENVTVRRGIFLGIFLGLNALLYAPTLLQIPLTILYLFIAVRPYHSVVLKTSIAIIFASLIVLTPWTIRNYFVFGKFVPVKTGIGLMAHLSNPIMAGTFAPGSYACSSEDGLTPSYEAIDARDAMVKSTLQLNGSFINRRAKECMERDVPEIKLMNEVDRNNVYMKKTFDFIRSEPLIFTDLAINRILHFFSFSSVFISSISFFSGIGIVLTLKNRKAAILILFVCAYTAPYTLAAPFYYRYRYPIEPILVILASYTIMTIATKLYAVFRN